MKKENRDLHRIPNTFGTDVIAHVVIGSEKWACTVNNYNTKSISINVCIDLINRLMKGILIDCITLMFGTEIKCQFNMPVVKLIDKKKSTIAILLTSTVIKEKSLNTHF